MIELCLDVPAERHSLSESSMKGCVDTCGCMAVYSQQPTT